MIPFQFPFVIEKEQEPGSLYSVKRKPVLDLSLLSVVD